MADTTYLHQAFLQSLLSRPYLLESSAETLYIRLLTILLSSSTDRSSASYIPGYTDRHRRMDEKRDKKKLRSEFLNELNEILSLVGMEIRRVKAESGGEAGGEGRKWLGLCNVLIEPVPSTSTGRGTSNNNNKDQQSTILSHATSLTPLELTYFRVLLSEIINSYPANSITSIHALSLATSLKPTQITKSAAEKISKALEQRGWLEKSKRGRWSVGKRGIMELGGWMIENFNGGAEDDDEEEDEIDIVKLCVLKCATQSPIVLTGYRCEKVGCDAHIHTTCLSKLKSHPRQLACPLCKTPWIDPTSTSDSEDIPENAVKPTPVGEDSVPVAEDRYGGGSGRKSGRKRKGAGGAGAGESDTDEEEEEEEEVEERPNKRRAQQARASQLSRQTASRNKRRQVEQEDEDDDELESEG